MNVPGPRKPSVSPPIQQIQTQGQQRGPQSYPPRGPTPPLRFGGTGQVIHEEIGGQYIRAQQQVYQTPVQQQQYLYNHQGGHPNEHMSKPSMPQHVPQQGQPNNAIQTQVIYNPNQQPGGTARPPTRYVNAQGSMARPMNPGAQRQQLGMQQASSAQFAPTQQPVYVQQYGQQLLVQTTPIMSFQQRQPMPANFAGMPSNQGQSYTLAPSAQPYYPQQASSNLYLGNMMQQPPMRQPAPANQPQNQMGYHSRREKKIIPIVDPSSGKSINDDIVGQSAANQRSSPPQTGNAANRAATGFAAPVRDSQQAPEGANNDVAAQFAAQVAATLTPSSKDTEEAPPAQQQPLQPPQEEPAPASAAISIVAPPPETTAPPPVEAEAPTAVPTEEPPAEEESAAAAESESKAPEQGEAPASGPLEEESQSSQGMPAAPSETEPTPVAIKEPSPAREPSPVVEPKEPTPEKVTEEVVTVVAEDKKENVPPKKEKTPPAEAPAPVVEKEAEVTEKPKVASAVTENTEDGKDMRKKTKKQKMKDLNQKGDTKQGDDMDAFVTEEEKRASPVPENEDKAPTPEKEVPPPEEPAKEPSPPPQPTEVEIRVENERVVEKNERNEELSSREPVDESIAKSEPVMKENKIELKYKYREDQWSPLNVEGKKSYDRSFLLQMQYDARSVEKPDGLPKLPDVILDKPYQKGNQGGGPRDMNFGSLSRNVPDFSPNFFKPNTSMGKSSSMNKRGSQQKRGPQGMGGPGGSQQKVINVAILTDVKLHESEHAWKPGVIAKANDVTEESKTEDLYKRVRSILNKLTPQKFQTLMEQILQLEIDTEERLKGTIDLVFEKAIDEPNFSVAYANMCKCMIHVKVPKEGSTSGDTATFRKILLNRCQKEFEKDASDSKVFERMEKEINECTDEAEKKRRREEKAMLESKAKRRSLGNIRFIGELFKLKMLTEAIMHDCVLKLLKSMDEDSLECLCRLLTTIGKDIDVEKAKTRMDQYFNQMDKIVKQKKTSARVRFMLRDIIDLRLHKWVPRREDNNPKTIDQIHEEVQREDQQRALLLQQVSQQQKSGGGPNTGGGRGGRGGRGGDRQQQQSEDGWQAVGRIKNTVDPSRMKLTKQNIDESNIQLGPAGRSSFSAWGRGSIGTAANKNSASASGQADSERANTPSNRFQALSAGSTGDSFGDSRGRPQRGGGGGMAGSRDSRGRMNLTPSRGKPVARGSMDQERDAAIAAVRGIVGGPGGRTPGSSREQSRESSRNRERSRDDASAKQFTDEELEKKTKAILDEYLHIQDSKEALACVREVASTKNLHVLVTTAFNHVLERSSQARLQTGALLHDLVRHEIVTVDHYVAGLKEVLEFAEDMEIDIPKIWQYLGELVGPMVQDNSLPLNFLKSACDGMPSLKKSGLLVSEVLHNASKQLGHIKVGEQWRQSGLQWSDFLSSDENIDAFLKAHKLEFTVSSGEPRSPDAKTFSMQAIEEHLRQLIVKKKADNEEVFDWIEANVGEPRCKDPSFIRALMTAVCSSAITDAGANMKVEEQVIKQRYVLLQKFLDHQADLELQALYALQALVHKLEHPSGVLRTFFDTLYDEDIISEDAFNQWESSEDPAEQEGKGVAKASVVQFFTWLREADEEDQD